MSAEVPFKPEVLDTAIEHLKAHPLSEEARVDVMKKMEEHVSSPEVLSETIKQVEALSGSALAIATDFDNISKILAKVHANAPQEFQKIMDAHKMADNWKSHRDTYVDNLWDSRRLADKARVVVNDFGNNLLPFLLDDTKTPEDKSIEINEYKKVLAENERKATEVSESFSKLHSTIVNFRAEWEKISTEFRQKADAAVVAIDGEIEKLTKELSSLASKIKAVLIVAGVGLGVAILVGLLNPLCGIVLAVIVVIATGIPAGILINEYIGKSKQLDAEKAKRAQLVSTVEAAKKIELELANAQKDFEHIITGLGAFSSIWATLRSDIDYAYESLDLIDNPGPKSKLYKTRLEAARVLYLALGVALEKYAKIVSVDHDLFKGKEVPSA